MQLGTDPAAHRQGDALSKQVCVATVPINMQILYSRWMSAAVETTAIKKWGKNKYLMNTWWRGTGKKVDKTNEVTGRYD